MTIHLAMERPIRRRYTKTSRFPEHYLYLISSLLYLNNHYLYVTYSEWNYRASPHIGQLSILALFPHEESRAMDYHPLELFGQHLVELRKVRGWSQERLALESGLARSYVGGIERGQRNLALVNICILAEALGVSPSEMLNFFPQKKHVRGT